MAEFMNMLQIGRIDTGSGTLFGVPQKRGIQKDRLTLVIGTGGSGKAVIQQAVSIANQKLVQDYSSFVKFLVIDSATEELDLLKRRGIDTLNITSPMAQIRLQPGNRSSFYKSFISRDFPVHRIGEHPERLQNKVQFYDQNGGLTNDQLLRGKIAGLFSGEWAAYKNLPVDTPPPA